MHEEKELRANWRVTVHSCTPSLEFQVCDRDHAWLVPFLPSSTYTTKKLTFTRTKSSTQTFLLVPLSQYTLKMFLAVGWSSPLLGVLHWLKEKSKYLCDSAVALTNIQTVTQFQYKHIYSFKIVSHYQFVFKNYQMVRHFNNMFLFTFSTVHGKIPYSLPN